MRSVISVLTLLILVAGGVGLHAANKVKCESVPNQYSDCTDWGGLYCSANAGGNCFSCAGPGGLPRKTCYTVEFTCNCSYSYTGCGSKQTGNCQRTSGGDWFCDGITNSGQCNLKNCSGGC